MTDFQLNQDFTASLKQCRHRRAFLKTGLAAFGAVCLPGNAFAVINRLISPARSLDLLNLHTGERLNICYIRSGKYLVESLLKINYILRDHRADVICTIDTNLLDLLHAVSLQVKSRRPFHIISGYRTNATNDMLRRCTKGVSANSLHTQGRAADIRLPGCKSNTLMQTAANLKKGGVGLYTSSDFVHIDTGVIRTWQS